MKELIVFSLLVSEDYELNIKWRLVTFYSRELLQRLLLVLQLFEQKECEA